MFHRFFIDVSTTFINVSLKLVEFPKMFRGFGWSFIDVLCNLCDFLKIVIEFVEFSSIDLEIGESFVYCLRF